MVLSMPRPFKHSKTGVYWFRQRVPSDLRAIASGKYALIEIDGKATRHKVGAELKVSLGTKSPSEAKARVLVAEAEFQRFWTMLRNPPRRLTQREVRALAGEVYAELVSSHQDDPGEPQGWEWLETVSREAVVGSGLRIGSPMPKAAVQSASDPVYRVLARKGLSVDADSRARLSAAIRSVMGDGAARLTQNARGDYSPDSMMAQFPAFSSPGQTSSSDTRRPIVSLSGLADNWANRIRRADDRTIKRYKGVIADLVAFVGHDDASQLGDEDIVRWHRILLESGRLSHATFIRTYRAAINAIYSYGMSPQGGKVVGHNPASRLRLEGPKETVNRHKYFTTEEARKILSAATLVDVPPKTAPHHRRAVRWVPWLGAYTGARPGELCQLRRQDFVMVDGIKCLALLPDAGTIKTGKFRSVPIHPHLLEQGIWEFAMGEPVGPLFYDAQLHSQRPWENARAFLSEWVRLRVGVTAPEVKPGHGWRHWFKAKGHTVGVAEEYLEAICGHAPASAGRKYGSYEPAALLRELSKFPAIKLDRGPDGAGVVSRSAPGA